MKNNFILTFLLSVLFSSSVLASEISISEQYVRETIPGTTISSAYMLIKNTGDKDVALKSITSPVSARIELHEHLMADGMMQMQQVESIIVKANDKTVLQPHGYHVMIFNLDEPLMAGSSIDMALKFDNGKTVNIKVPVQGLKKKTHSHSHNH
ncbi:copper chaperone PCu(A)C [Thalassomonas sp. M1454]|uniref:copper chaperone PCu(A)C n=1 Tax=Thalassomonas sp. M1454 TaxID=2594477 RepID=UPI00117E43D8|nr:copper chaperone PCu(A)C [Thalassomonas sp. M1454]TRX53480.1 copper chaperone PCu(A)C [Thalassomonas sp. M1454]